MIIKFKNIVEAVKKFEKKKNIEVTKKEKKRFDKFYLRLDEFSNIINHWKSRVERILIKYQEDRKNPYD